MVKAYEENELVKKYVGLIHELGHFPVEGEIRRQSKQDSSFPSHTVLGFKRFGGKGKLAAKIINFCRTQGGLDDVIKICTELASPDGPSSQESNELVPAEPIGFVYLMKSGRYYKIGRSAAVGRREYELGIQLPEKVATVHTIKTDDPGVSKPIGINGSRAEERMANGLNLPPKMLRHSSDGNLCDCFLTRCSTIKWIQKILF
jgi:hypothetical protein